jgi:SHS family lactate transporter-like MFS transporter
MSNRPEIQTEADYEAEQFTKSRSVKSQLAAWHANRGEKSFLRAMIPTWHTSVAGEEGVTKNPFKLLGMVSKFGWMMFLSVSRVLQMWGRADR